MSDPRHNLPSASGLSRIVMCPGSWLLESQLPEGDTTPESESGTKIHASLSGVEIELTEPESKTRRMCEDLAQKIADEHGFSGITPTAEERIWLYSQDDKRVFSGQYDRLYLNHASSSALVCEFKTFQGEVEDAANNWQQRAQAVLVAKNYGVKEVLVAKIQPWVSPQVSLCKYEEGDLIASELAIRTALAAALDVDAIRIPGLAQCKYCKAKTICPESRASVMTVVSTQTKALSPVQFGKFLDACQLAEKIIKDAKATAKELLKLDPLLVAGWTLAPGKINKPITDPQKVWGRVAAAGVSLDAFMATVEISKSDLEIAVKAATGLKGEKLEETMTELLDGCTTPKQCEPSLKKIK